jgi:Fe-S cluster assembly protein SufB
MSTAAQPIERFLEREYTAGFVTELETDTVPKGLSEDIIRLISARKREPAFMLDWRLESYRRWLTMSPPTWAQVRFPPIDFQDIVYYSAPKSRKDGPKSLDEVDPALLRTFDKLGVPLHERARLAGVAVDAVFDSVSVGPPSRRSSPSSASSSAPSLRR